MPRPEITRALVDAATDAVATLLRFDRPADAALRAWFRTQPQLGARDRAFTAESAFAVLRHLRRLEAVGGRRDARGLLLAALVLVRGHAVRSVEPAIRREDVEWLIGLRERGEPADLPDDIRLSQPDWLWERLVAQYGRETARSLAASLLEPAPLDLRVNTIKARRESVLETLREDGIDAEPAPMAPQGIRVRQKAALERHPLVSSGMVEVQDEGSQLVAMLLQPRRGQMVVDFCAGAGGKTLALGALMRSEGRLYAFDVSERRLANLKPRLKRSGLSNVHPQVLDSENDARVRRLAGKIDGVLVDAPCSGTGTLRRNPDLKWRMNPASIDELVEKQRRILTAAASLARTGGRLVYATCSLLAEENEDVVRDFLAASPEWRCLDAHAILEAQGVSTGGAGEHLRLLPHVHRTDGFFAAVLERSA